MMIQTIAMMALNRFVASISASDRMDLEKDSMEKDRNSTRDILYKMTIHH